MNRRARVLFAICLLPLFFAGCRRDGADPGSTGVTTVLEVPFSKGPPGFDKDNVPKKPGRQDNLIMIEAPIGQGPPPKEPPEQGKPDR